MMKRSHLALGAGLGLLLAVAAWGQSVVQNTLSGNETWSVGQGPGGPSSYITSNMVRNSATDVVATVVGNEVVPKIMYFGGNLIISAQPSAAVITLPPNPVPAGTIIGVCNGTTSAFATNAVTLVANSGQTLVQTITLTTLAAGTCVHVQFHRATTTWYQV